MSHQGVAFRTLVSICGCDRGSPILQVRPKMELPATLEHDTDQTPKKKKKRLPLAGPLAETQIFEAHPGKGRNRHRTATMVGSFFMGLHVCFDGGACRTVRYLSTWT